jgi:hypothetical protein
VHAGLQLQRLLLLLLLSDGMQALLCRLLLLYNGVAALLLLLLLLAFENLQGLRQSMQLVLLLLLLLVLVRSWLQRHKLLQCCCRHSCRGSATSEGNATRSHRVHDRQQWRATTKGSSGSSWLLLLL